MTTATREFYRLVRRWVNNYKALTTPLRTLLAAQVGAHPLYGAHREAAYQAAFRQRDHRRRLAEREAIRAKHGKPAKRRR